MAKIMMVSTVHKTMDMRILQREALSLSKAGYDVSFLSVCDGQSDFQGVKILPIKPTNNRKVRMFLRPFSVIKSVFKYKPDAVHFHDPELLPAALFLRLFGFTTVYDAHEDFPAQTLSKYWLPEKKRLNLAKWAARYVNFCTKRMHQIIAATPRIKSELEKNNQYIDIVNNYPKLDEFPEIIPWEDRESKIIFIGGATRIRGFVELVDSLSQCKVPLDFAGEIDPPELREELEKLEGWQYVTELGFLPRKETALALGTSKIGIVTYKPEPNHLHAQPNKIFEYMAAGIPMVVSDFPYWRELLGKYDCAEFVDPENPTEIAAAIARLHENDDRSRRMGESGRKAIEVEYNWDIEAKNLCSIYKKLFERRKPKSEK